MKPKLIIPLAIVFAALAALILMKRGQEVQVSLTDQAELKLLVPENLDVTSVNRLEIFAGVKAGERVVLTKDGDIWRIASMYNAKAVDGRAQQMLDAVAGLQGEFRATVSGEALADYDLTDERAFHVMGFTGEREEVFHVLTGKSPKYGDMFMRAASSDDVYVVNKNIRRDAFLYSLDYDDPPTSEPWLDKQIVGIAGDDYTSVEMTMADKVLKAEKRKIESEPIVAAEGEDAPAPTPEPEYEWVVTEGGFRGEVHQTPFRDMERYASNLAAFTVVSPEKKSIWGLDDPNNHLLLHRENGDTIELAISHPMTFGPAYVQRLDNIDETLYSIELNKFQALFASGSAYYDLPGLLLEEDAITTATYTTPDGEVTITRDGSGWALATPVSDFPVNQKALATLERTLSSWQAVDYADASFDAGFDESEHEVTFTTKDKTHRILLGAEAKHVHGRYAKLNDSTDTLVMSQADYNDIFLQPKDLFESNLVPVDDGDEIVHLEMTREGVTTVFDLGELAWEITTGEDSFEPIEATVDSFLTTLSAAIVKDVVIAPRENPGNAVGTLTITTDKGVSRTLAFSLLEDDDYSVSVNGSTSTYTIDLNTYNSFFPAINTFGSATSTEEITFKPPVLTPQPAHDEHDGHNH